jgi:uncharacterized repeat protein (TIGR02543 family)/LPXTG-motif cell wall-anchored protein
MVFRRKHKKISVYAAILFIVYTLSCSSTTFIVAAEETGQIPMEEVAEVSVEETEIPVEEAERVPAEEPNVEEHQELDETMPEATAEEVTLQEPVLEKDTRDVKYHVSYHLNRGAGEEVADNNEYSLNELVTVKSPVNLTRRNFVFDGWNTQLNGNGVDIPSGSAFVIITDVTLYAKWIRVSTLGGEEERYDSTHEDDELWDEEESENEEQAEEEEQIEVEGEWEEDPADTLSNKSKDSKNVDKTIANKNSNAIKAGDDPESTTQGNINNADKDTKSNTDNNTNVDTSGVKPQTTNQQTKKPSYASTATRKVTSVKTGDNSQIILYVVGALAGIGIIVFLVISSRKKKEQDK